MKKLPWLAMLLAVGFLSAQQTYALTYAEVANQGRVLSEQSYQTATLFNRSNLTLSFTPYDFDEGSGKWNYQVSWQRLRNRSGSIYINGNVFVADASGSGSNYTGYNLSPQTRYRITYYSQSNGRGVRIVNRYFITLAAPVDSEDEEDGDQPDNPIPVPTPNPPIPVPNPQPGQPTPPPNSNHPPDIVGLPAVPVSVQPGQSVNFTWTATDPDNDSLAWAVDWGDRSGLASTCAVSGSGSVSFQSGANRQFSASHAWANAGAYTITATASDCRGGTDTSSLTVQVGSTNPQPAVLIVSPNGGERFDIGSSNVIRWSGGRNRVQIGLATGFNFSPGGDGVVLGWINGNAGTDGQLIWDAREVADLAGGSRWPVNAGANYRIIAVSEDANGNYCFSSSSAYTSTCNFDLSNSTFVISAPAATVLAVAKNPALGTPSYAQSAVEAKIGSYLIAGLPADSVSLSSLTITMGADGGQFQNLKVKIGSTQFGPIMGTLSSNGSYTFTGTAFIIPARASMTIDVYADIPILAAVGTKPVITTLSGCAATSLNYSAPVSCGSAPGQDVTITSSETFASITVVSPNGGETLVMGQPYTIQWGGGYAAATDPTRAVSLMLVMEDGITQVGWIQFGNGPSGTYAWDPAKVRSALGYAYNVNVTAGKYKIRAIDYNDPRGTTQAYDISDGTIIISN